MAQVLDNVRWPKRRRRATSRLRLLARAGELLKVELDLGQRLRRVAQMMLPDFADGAAVYLLEPGGVRLAAAGHTDPAVQVALEQADLPLHGLRDDLPPAEAIRTNQAVLVGRTVA